MTIQQFGEITIISGPVSVDEARKVPYLAPDGGFYHTVDLSQGEFGVKEETGYACLGYGHSGPVYSSRKSTKTVDALSVLVDRLFAGTVILPASVTKKQLNICVKNEMISRFVVPDDCRLFAMKDGSIWNKKGEIMIHKQPETADLVKCDNCGRLSPRSDVEVTENGKLICRFCHH